MVAAGGTLNWTRHWQVDPAFQEVPFSLLLAAVLGAAVRAAVHAAGAGEVELEVVAQQALVALAFGAGLAVLGAAIEALSRREVLRLGTGEAGGGGAVHQRAGGQAVRGLVPVSAGEAADHAVDHSIIQAARDIFFEAGRVVLEVARHALETELLLEAILAVVSALHATAIIQKVSLEASETGGDVAGLAGGAVAEARDALEGVPSCGIVNVALDAVIAVVLA